MSAGIGLIGGRGYTGGELLGLLAGHPQMELAFASSSSEAGSIIQESCPQWPDPQTRFLPIGIAEVENHPADAWVLALPNGKAAQWARAIGEAHPGATIVDLSADHRFDPDWAYGLPELNRDQVAASRRIANPGCYATGAQVALWPVRDLLSAPPAIFGVSGYSGAGKTPSQRNDPGRLEDNLLAYSLSGHVHEREVSARLGVDVRFMPHVAPFFRGISLTVSATLDREQSASDLYRHYSDYYREEQRVKIMVEPPEVSRVRYSHDIHVGGFTVDDRDPRRITLVAALDNLSKGAASQALQNLNLALGMPEHAGLEPGEKPDD